MKNQRAVKTLVTPHLNSLVQPLSTTKGVILKVMKEERRWKKKTMKKIVLLAIQKVDQKKNLKSLGIKCCLKNHQSLKIVILIKVDLPQNLPHPEELPVIKMKV